MNDDSGYILPVAFPAAFRSPSIAGELSRVTAEIFKNLAENSPVQVREMNRLF